jgi:hypothetical protein
MKESSKTFFFQTFHSLSLSLSSSDFPPCDSVVLFSRSADYTDCENVKERGERLRDDKVSPVRGLCKGLRERKIREKDIREREREAKSYSYVSVGRR